MPDIFIFADEAGCFTFNKNQNVSRFFILCTIIMKDCSIAKDLLDLRRELAWRKFELNDSFHATVDKQVVRDKVFEIIAAYNFTIQATIMEKSKAQSHIRENRPTFYKYGYYYHFKHSIMPRLEQNTKTLVTTACLGTRNERTAFQNAVTEVMQKTQKNNIWNTDFMPAQADPCLQVADYCAWAIQRKWERNDLRSYQGIKNKIEYEFDLWKKGTIHYY